MNLHYAVGAVNESVGQAGMKAKKKVPSCGGPQSFSAAPCGWITKNLTVCFCRLVRRRKPEMIIRENQPMELPPDVVRGIFFVLVFPRSIFPLCTEPLNTLTLYLNGWCD